MKNGFHVDTPSKKIIFCFFAVNVALVSLICGRKFSLETFDLSVAFVYFRRIFGEGVRRFLTYML